MVQPDVDPGSGVLQPVLYWLEQGSRNSQKVSALLEQDLDNSQKVLARVEHGPDNSQKVLTVLVLRWSGLSAETDRMMCSQRDGTCDWP